jgi:hypothetical protein
MMAVTGMETAGRVPTAMMLLAMMMSACRSLN